MKPTVVVQTRLFLKNRIEPFYDGQINVPVCKCLEDAAKVFSGGLILPDFCYHVIIKVREVLCLHRLGKIQHGVVHQLFEFRFGRQTSSLCFGCCLGYCFDMNAQELPRRGLIDVFELKGNSNRVHLVFTLKDQQTLVVY